MGVPKLLYNIQEVAECLGVTDRTVYKWIDEHGFPVLKIGGSVRFSPKAVQEWIDARVATAQSTASGHSVDHLQSQETHQVSAN